MTQTGKVTGQAIAKNRDGVADVRLLQVELGTDAQSDPQTIQYVPLSGDDSPPIDGDTVFVLALGPAFKIAFGVQDSVVPSMDAGAKKVYSRDSSGVIAAFINYLTDGNLELNGNAYSAVRFQELQTKLTALEAQLVAHVHPGVTSGPSSTGASVTPFDADISTAESDTVKLK